MSSVQGILIIAIVPVPTMALLLVFYFQSQKFLSKLTVKSVVLKRCVVYVCSLYTSLGIKMETILIIINPILLLLPA